MAESADQTPPERPPERRLTVSDAALELGLSAEAVRSRIKRETLRSEKSGSTVYVLLSGESQGQAHPVLDQTAPQHDQTGNQASTGRSRTDAHEELVESLLDQVAYMREQLAEEREARRRADTIIVQLTQANATLARRVPELEPPEPRDDPETATEGADRGNVPSEQQEPSQRRSWLYRFVFRP